jgi:hypothetical protein
LQESTPKQTLVAGKPEDLNDLAIADLETGRPNILEEADEADGGEVAARPLPLVAGMGPAPAAPMGPPLPPAAAAAPPVAHKPAGPRVPNFRGKTMRAVLAEAAAKGISILPDGSGIARVQSPPPGTPLRQGERIRVQFVQ